MAIIKIKRGTTDPTAAQVTNIGELAANTSTPKIFLKTASDASTTPVWVGATIEASPGDWTSATKLATQSAINTTFMPKSGGAFTGNITLNAQSDLRFADSDSSNYVAFEAPATVAANVTWILPSADGSNGQVLTTNGTGTLSWSGASATNVTVTSSNVASTVYPVFVTAVGASVGLLADDSTGPLSYVPSTGVLTLAGDINVNGGDVITSATTASVFDTNATTLTMGAAATSFTSGYTGVAASTYNLSTGVVGSGATKTVNIGTGGAAGSTTNVNLGSANGGTVAVANNLTVGGNLTISGTTTTVNSTTLTVNDPLIALANNNSTTDAVDIGFYGLYDTSGTLDLYAGLFRDATDDKFKLFKSLQSAPTTTVNTAGTGYTVATLVADVEGKVNGLTVTSSTGTLTVANGKTLTASNTLTFTGTDSSSVAFGAGGTVAYLGTANAFTAANTFTNATGQTFRQAATQDGVILNGRAGGTTSLAVTITPTTLSSSRTYTLPDVDGTAITTGNLTAITATGTIASGTWNGTAIAAAYGGTGQTSYTVGDLVYASGSTALSKLSSSATAGAVLASTGSAAAPEYKTISFTNGTVTSGTGTLTLAVQNAAADGTTKGIAAFNSTDFDAASGVITIDTVDGGTY